MKSGGLMMCFSMGLCCEERWVNDVFLYGCVL